MRAARTDANQAEIITALRAVGCAVKDCSRVGEGFPDLLVLRRGYGIYLLEVKREKGKLNERQKRWHEEWFGYVSVVRSVDEALKVVGVK